MSAATLYTGLDLHKRSVVATTLDADGTTVAHRKLPARPEALALYFADLPPGTERRAVAEATNGWYWVQGALAALDIDFRLAHAKGVKAITSAKVKTDAHDARTLAQLLRVNLLPGSWSIRTGPSDQRRAPPTP
jgi:transposase